MPRKARINAPGALHHNIVLGIERRRICSDDQHQDNFKERLGDIVTETKTFCFALALTPNPHILLCYWAVRKLGFSAAELSKKLSFAQPSVSIR